MNFKSIVFCAWLIMPCLFFGQEDRFFIPQEIKMAYENGTRSYDGRPGVTYWHNTVDYTIEVEVVPSEKKLSGIAEIVYHNHSPDPLSQMVIRLYHDVFRKGNNRAFSVKEDDITEGIEIPWLLIEGDTMELSNPQIVRRTGTNMYIQLLSPLPSGEKLNMKLAWSQMIPETTVRTGAYDSTSFFCAYWYPQVAVYDDLFGWDNLAYDFSTEFYNNLGNYDVKITAPHHFTVLSTGVLQNSQDVLTEDLLERYNQAKRAAEPVTIISPLDLENGIKHQSNTWHYKADEVSDFAFCLSDHYCWEAISQEVEGRDVLIHSYYNVSIADQAGEVTANQRKMMKHFSEDIPGIPYPYPEFTTFITGAGGGGMEYPMMANNGGPGLGVTVHEMFHTYFPMYVRTNEKRFAWMDEGWADFVTSYITNDYFNENAQEETPIFGRFSTQVTNSLGTLSDLPLITSTQFLDNSNYGYASYPLPAFLYSILYQHLGESLFLKCYREYIRRWAKKSPTPYDFMYTFENISGQDLNWFWQPWFFGFGTVDIAIDEYKNGKLILENKGSRPVPIVVKTEYKDSSYQHQYFSAKRWTEKSVQKIKLPRKKDIVAVSVNYNIPDKHVLDNYYPSLSERYGDFVITEGLLGNYAIKEFPVTAILSKKDNLLFLDIPGTGVSTYLIIKPDGNFESIDGNIQLQLEKKENVYTGLNMQLFGFSITAEKK